MGNKEEVLRQAQIYAEIWAGTRSVDELEDVINPDLVIETPLQPDFHGLEGLLNMHTMWTTTISPWQFSIKLVYGPEANQVTAPYTIWGLFAKDFGPLKATLAPVYGRGVAVLTFDENSRLVHHQNYGDGDELIKILSGSIKAPDLRVGAENAEDVSAKLRLQMKVPVENHMKADKKFLKQQAQAWLEMANGVRTVDDVTDQVYAKDAVIIGPLEEPRRGREAARESCKNWMKTITQLHASGKTVAGPANNQVMLIGKMRGKFTSNFGPLPATNKWVALPFVITFTFDKTGRVIHEHMCADGDVMVKQMTGQIEVPDLTVSQTTEQRTSVTETKTVLKEEKAEVRIMGA